MPSSSTVDHELRRHDSIAFGPTELKSWVDCQYTGLSPQCYTLASTTFGTVVRCYAKAYGVNIGNVWFEQPTGKLKALRPADQNVLLEEDSSGMSYLQKVWAILLSRLPKLADEIPNYPQGDIPVELLTQDCQDLLEVEDGVVYVRRSPNGRYYWGESGEGRQRGLDHMRETDPANTLLHQEKADHPQGRGWQSKAVLHCDDAVPATMRHVQESLLCAVTTSVGLASSLNVRLWDIQFYKHDYKVPPSGVLTFLEKVTACVESGELLPSRTDSDGWLALFGEAVPNISGYWMNQVARGHWRKHLSVPYLEKHPIHPNSWAASAPASLNAKKVRLGKRRRQPRTTAAEDEELASKLTRVSSQLGSKRLRRKAKEI